MSSEHNHDLGWFEKPENIRKIIVTLVVTCVLLVIGSEVTAYLHLWHKHTYFQVEQIIPAFYALFGFIAYCGIVWAAVGLRTFISREEDYYDR